MNKNKQKVQQDCPVCKQPMQRLKHSIICGCGFKMIVDKRKKIM
ncbi:hypothetical protein ABER75_08850 [Niallia taxi]|nr:hypothetical protein [Niallia taxi]MDK8639156.1 hypothetical protein [Niallia taxi]MED4036960.1 hypothetical protein [Niallia taxi]MED4053224.1 hypothetical protein [Niallia taxi]MED4119064.1 hypothetical protein [Niallia taxi]